MEVSPLTCSRFVVAACLALAIGSLPKATSAGEPVEAKANSKADADRARFFEQKVRPLLVEKCYSCHGSKKQKGGLRLDSLEAALKGARPARRSNRGSPTKACWWARSAMRTSKCPPRASLKPTRSPS